MAASQVHDEAFVTLTTNDTYAYGALVLGHSLRAAGTSRRLAVMVTPGVTSRMRQLLSDVFDNITQVDPLDSNDEANLALLTRPELGITFSKLHCWRLTQYSKCVFMDADTVVLRNIDDLFDRDELSAAPDVGWPDLFNSGVFVFKPSEETYKGLLQCSVTQGSFDGGDQGLLNTYFGDWSTKDIARHLPFIYNMTASRAYSYLPAFVRFGDDVKVVHFIGIVKPWQYTFDTSSGHVISHEATTSQHELSFVQAWWDIFIAKVKPALESLQAQDLIDYARKLESSNISQDSYSSHYQESDESNVSGRTHRDGSVPQLGQEDTRLYNRLLRYQIPPELQTRENYCPPIPDKELLELIKTYEEEARNVIHLEIRMIDDEKEEEDDGVKVVEGKNGKMSKETREQRIQKMEAKLFADYIRKKLSELLLQVWTVVIVVQISFLQDGVLMGIQLLGT
ncbi:glycogenin-1-like isoform X2 [Glandiceps talaboti]